MRNIWIIIAMLFVAGACSKSEIETWSAKPRASFYMRNDTVSFSFTTQPEGTTEGVVKLGITIAGRLADVDRHIAIKGLGGSPSNPGSRYEIVSAIIPAGKKRGDALIKVYKTDNLDIANDTLSSEVVASKEFEVGEEDHLRNAVIVSNLWTQPSWWDNYHLGEYSVKKLEIIYQVLGSTKVFENVKSWYDDDVRIAIYKLNRYCKDNNVKYNPEDESVIQFESGSK